MSERGEMQVLKSDQEELDGFNRWLRYNLEHGSLSSSPKFKVDRDRFPTHYALAGGDTVVCSPEFRALLNRARRA